MGVKKGVYFEDNILSELEKLSEDAKSFSDVVNKVCLEGLKTFSLPERVTKEKELRDLMKEEKMLRKMLNTVKRSGAYAQEHLDSLVGGKGKKPQFQRFPKKVRGDENPTYVPTDDSQLVNAPRHEIETEAIILLRLESVVSKMCDLVKGLYPEYSKKFRLKKNERGEWRIFVEGKQTVHVPRDVSLSHKELLEGLKGGK